MSYPYSMRLFYDVIGISKQGVYDMEHRWRKRSESMENLLCMVQEIRSKHPTMAVRHMYHKLQPQNIGRDKFEEFCSIHGLGAKRHRNYRRTTDSYGVKRFENLERGFTPQSMNQLWQSDITYFEVMGRFYYLTFIVDSFSRYIVGYSVSKYLMTEHTTIPALKMAIKFRKKENVSNLILHSDGGGQYYDKDFLKLTKSYNIRNSMCEYAWENGKAERINGVIKNNYLIHKNITSFNMLVKEVGKTVRLYNTDKPHCKLNYLTPADYEKMLSLQIEN